MPLPSVAIVIPTRNRIEALKECLSRLIPYVSAHPECRVVISDDGDAQQTAQALAPDLDRVRIIQGPRRGPAANRNWGAANSLGDLVVFLDDDCIPDSDLISTYKNAASNHPEVGVFEGRISPVGEVSSFADSAPSNETGGYLWSCNFAIRRSLFERIGGFDERYPFAAVEDVDLHFRVKSLSPVLFLPEARVSHRLERRLGWKLVQHHTLSVLLLLHIHGLNATDKNSLFYLRMAVRSLLFDGFRHLRAGTAKHPMYLLHRVWANLQLSLIILLWRFHGTVARWLYSPCCPGCESVLTALAAPGNSWAALQEKSGVSNSSTISHVG